MNSIAFIDLEVSTKSKQIEGFGAFKIDECFMNSNNASEFLFFIEIKITFLEQYI